MDYFIALGVGLAAALLANRLLGRARLNPGTVAAYLILALIVVEAALLWSRGPKSAAAGVGLVVFAHAAIPLLTAVALSFHFRKKRRF
jgi:hypothetical protein